ncbi:MAG: hypothetical protein Q4G63_07780 [Bacteroidia bacterium]|nr:hypothetical protein [Bacteroidia bacterium]
MNLKKGLKIQIKRATTCGIKECWACYFEFESVQYGFIECKADKRYYAIHLDTGYSVGEIENNTKRAKGFELLKDKIKTTPKAKIEKALKKAKKDMRVRGFDYPLN